MVGLALCVYVV